jgi:hypothetical protein
VLGGLRSLQVSLIFFRERHALTRRAVVRRLKPGRRFSEVCQKLQKPRKKIEQEITEGTEKNTRPNQGCNRSLAPSKTATRDLPQSLSDLVFFMTAFSVLSVVSCSIFPWFLQLLRQPAYLSHLGFKLKPREDFFMRACERKLPHLFLFEPATFAL